ncbi:hypothetical protein AY599_10820 [Leptolyngbya valderiana BDU 20041]|nr:hypothetical protein [Geitlerinema sp. CS-897]OAB62283.1 hypothetical protein AY599_10820 [Leptolyngbya valderiana BDU 20041]
MVNSRNTKSEILAAYKELQKEKKSLEAKIKQGTKSQSENSTPSTVESNRTRASAKTEQERMQDTIAQLTGLKLGFGSSVSQLSEQLTREASQLGEVQSQVSEAIARLTQLYDLSDIQDETLDNLIREYEESEKQFSDVFETERETLEQAFFEEETAWQKEREDRHEAIAERNAEYRKACERDEREYRYDRDLQRQTDAEAYQQQQAELYRQLDETRQQQEKAWEDREKAISERETEFEEVMAKVEAFPAEKEAQIERGKEVGRNIAIAQTKANAELRQKEIEGEKQRYELQVRALEETIHDREIRIANLTQQLETTLKQTQELAVKAIEGTANEKSLQAVKDIALEQAKNQQRGK